MLQLERADPEQVAPRTDQGRAAPIRMGGRREKRLVEEVFPVSGEFLPRHDPGRQGTGAAAGPADDDLLMQRRLP